MKLTFSLCFYSQLIQPPRCMRDLPFHPSPINTMQFSTDEVYEALISLHPRKAAGVDDIDPRVLHLL